MNHERYMAHCIELAKKGGKATKSNPMVGSILVSDHQIIGSGFHEAYGKDHAERNAINQAKVNYPEKIAGATLYVTLEPCFHQGKTPPCVNFILENKIKNLVIGTTDPNKLTAGKSINKLKEEGCVIVQGVLETECQNLIRKFKSNLSKRPFVILKWAQSKDGYIGQKTGPIKLSNQFTDILVHKWRSEIDGIMIGTGTALIDNPHLTNRHWTGDTPTRIVIDQDNKILASANIFNAEAKTIVLSSEQAAKEVSSKQIVLVKSDEIREYLDVLYQQEIYSVLVEGGAQLLKSFINSGFWDEARVITTPKKLGSGIKAPMIIGHLASTMLIKNDEINTIYPE